jgi:hypothetical protein
VGRRTRTHSEFCRRGEDAKVGLQLHSFFEALEEELLELDDLLDVAKDLLGVLSGEEGFLF